MNLQQVRRAKEVIEGCKFNPETDFFLPIGPQSLVTLCALVLGDVFPGKPIKILQWDSVVRRYISIEVDPVGRAK